MSLPSRSTQSWVVVGGEMVIKATLSTAVRGQDLRKPSVSWELRDGSEEVSRSTPPP